MQATAAPTRIRARRSTTSTQAEALYFQEVAEHQLLTAEEEVQLAKIVERGIAATNTLADRDSQLDPVESETLASQVQAAVEASRALIERNLRLVVWIARHYQGLGLPLLDLVQEGNLGLEHAVWHYDWRRGARFSTYAYWWIRQAIVAAVRSEGRVIRLPVEIQANLIASRRAESVLRDELGREPRVAEVAERLGVSERTIDQARLAAAPMISLSEPVSRDGDYTWEEVIPDDDRASGLVRVIAEETAEQLRTLLEVLDSTERSVVKLRFGLDGRGPYDVRELAKAMRVSRETIREILDRAIAKLRRQVRCQPSMLEAA